MGFKDFFKQNKKKEAERRTDEPHVDQNQQEFMNDMTANADRFQRVYNERLGNTLDFSLESLSSLDDLLEQFHQNLHDVDAEMKEDLIAHAGSYIFEVARRNYGGKFFWFEPLNQPILVTGIPEFEISITAFDKVRTRLENGKEDNIPFYFKGYESRVKNGKTGDKALVN